MKKLLLYTPLLFSSLTVFAQCYDVDQRAYFPDPYGEGEAVTLADDQYSDVIDIGFDFCFFGDTVSQLLISSNGYVTFNLGDANGNSPWGIADSVPSANLPTFSIMAPFQDLRPNDGGLIKFHKFGVAPYRRFVVSYFEVAMFECTDLSFTNQIVLHESLNIIDINIQDKELCVDWNNGLAIEGIQNQDGSEGYTVIGRNYPEQWSTSHDSYRFTPICDCPSDSTIASGMVPGAVIWDQNGDCEAGEHEPKLANVKIDIQPGNGSAWTNTNGEFAIMMDPGEYTFSHSDQNEWYLVNTCNTMPTSVMVAADSSALDIMFFDSIIPVHDLEVNIATTPAQACFSTIQYITACNNGTIAAENAVVSVGISSFVEVTETDLTYLTDTTWVDTIPLLLPGECVNYYAIGDVMCELAVVDEMACFTANITLLPDEVDSLNNTDITCKPILTSFDPNDKRVQAQNPMDGWVVEEDIIEDDLLVYMIRFQNTGTGPAFNVIIEDQISPYLDANTIDPIIASHDYYVQMMDGKLTVHFLGIELPDSASDPVGSQGFFQFSIQQNPGNQEGTVIENQAQIYFDFNEPVATNTTYNEIPIFNSTFEAETGRLSIYPNPASAELFIETEILEAMTVEILDLTGREVISKAHSGSRVQMDVADLPDGAYILKISYEGNTVVNRFVKN